MVLKIDNIEGRSFCESGFFIYSLRPTVVLASLERPWLATALRAAARRGSTRNKKFAMSIYIPVWFPILSVFNQDMEETLL